MTAPVADAGPIISLARASLLPVLQHVFPTIIVSPIVYKEIVEAGVGRPGSVEVGSGSGFMLRSLADTSVLERVSDRLDAGERESLALALELGRPILVDEKAGRKEAARLGLERFSTLLVLSRARASAYIERVGPALDALLATGFRLSDPFRRAFLQDHREL